MRSSLWLDCRIIRAWDSGVGRLAVGLAGALPALLSDERCTLLLDSRAEEVPCALPKEIEVVRLTAGCPSVRQHALLPRALAHRGCDVVFHLHPFSAPLWSRVPCVLGILDLYPLIDRSGFPPGTGAYIKHIGGMIARRARAVMTISEASKRDITRFLRVHADRIHVIPLAPGPEFDHVPPGTLREAVLARLGVRRPFILYHGNQRPHKNVERLVAVFAAAHRAYRLPHRLVVTGREIPGSRDRDFRSLRDAAEREDVSGLIDFTGQVTDPELAILYSAADALFLPSLMEGFGLPAVEAFACGTPVICSDRGALAEVAGGAALLVDPTDETHMARQLGGLLSNDTSRARLTALGRERAAEYSWERAASSFLSVMRMARDGAR